MAQKNPTIASLKNRLYGNRLAVRLVHSDTAAVGDRIPGIIMDSSGWKRTSIHPTHAGTFSINKNVIITDFRVSEGIVFINDKSAVYRTAALVIPKVIEESAKAAINTPIHPYSKIAAILSSQIKRKVSTCGTIISNNAKVKAGTAEKKEITIADETEQIRVTLWRSAAEVETMVGQKIRIKDCFVDKNKFLDAMTINVNNKSSIEILQQQDEEVNITIFGIKPQTDNSGGLLVLAEAGGFDRELSIEVECLAEFLHIEEGCKDRIEEIVEILPQTIRAKIVSNAIKKNIKLKFNLSVY